MLTIAQSLIDFSRSSFVPGPPLRSTTETLIGVVSLGKASFSSRFRGKSQGCCRSTWRLDQGHLLSAHKISGLDLRADWWEPHAKHGWSLSGVCRGLGAIGGAFLSGPLTQVGLLLGPSQLNSSFPAVVASLIMTLAAIY